MAKSTTSRQKACYALSELLKTRNIHKITVNEILKKAGISRSQFYRLFKDKYDLLNQTIALQVDLIFSDPADISFILDNLVALLEMVRDAYLTTSFFHNEYNELFQICFEMILRLLQRHINQAQKKDASPRQTRAMRFAAAGSATMILDWLGGGCRETPQQIAEELIQILSSFILYE